MRWELIKAIENSSEQKILKLMTFQIKYSFRSNSITENHLRTVTVTVIIVVVVVVDVVIVVVLLLLLLSLSLLLV